MADKPTVRVDLTTWDIRKHASEEMQRVFECWDNRAGFDDTVDAIDALAEAVAVGAVMTAIADLQRQGFEVVVARPGTDTRSS